MSRVRRTCICMEGLLIRGWALNSLGSAGSTNPNQSAIATSGVRVSIPCGAVSTQRTTVFVPDLLGSKMYGRSADPGMESYPPRVRRDLEVPAKGNSLHAPDAPPLAEGGRGGLDQWDWASENAVLKVVSCVLCCNPRLVRYSHQSRV